MTSPTVDHKNRLVFQCWFCTNVCEQEGVSRDEISVRFGDGDYEFDDPDFASRCVAYHDEDADLQWLAADQQNMEYHAWLNEEKKTAEHED